MPQSLQTERRILLRTHEMAAYVSDVKNTKQTTSRKIEALPTLTDDMIADLRYAETTVNYHDDQFSRIGSGRCKSKVSIEATGETRSLKALREGEGGGFLEWRESVDDGAVAPCMIQRREHPSDASGDAGMAIERAITPTYQDRGKEWECRVLAVNKDSEDKTGKTVMAML